FLNSKMSATFFEQTTKLDYKIFAPGVDTSLFQPDFQYSNKRIKILYTGRFSKEKGVDDLRQLIKSTPFVDWVLIGEMSEGYNLDFSHNAIYLGFLDQFRLAKEMPKSDLFVFYGKWDTFGMVALEALSCGLPVLAIKGSEIGRIVESNNCGGTFSTREELVELIMEFSKNGIDSEIQRNARFYAEKMTWGKSFGNFIEIL
ncbi:MAG: glycosyltransferase, partial [Crocinitomicaceae bacterium]